MRPALKFIVPAVAASLTLAACGSSSSGSGSSSQASTAAAATTAASSGGTSAVLVKSAANATLHATLLVNAQGMTLYALSGEQGGKFICTSSACTQIWHPLTASSATPSGSVGSLGTVKRPDGTEQVTYKGMPLYTFSEDQTAGEAKGQGIKDVGTWTAVTIGGAQSSSAPAAATPATRPVEPAPPVKSESSSGGGGSYGY
jgi:predicted lipoprotein with Yx(FWY)xxD motif